ncbi:MAG: hypothetical protein M3Z04_18555, partial [Chloroflexota bacterium]|nr:hypothetical protein [Chloroflexota bacterium]
MSIFRRRVYAPIRSLLLCTGIVLLSVTPTFAAGSTTKTGSQAGRTTPAAKSPAKSTPTAQRTVVVAVAKTTPKPVAKATPKPVAKATPKPVAKATPKP